MNMCTKFQVNIFKKWLIYDIKHVKNRHFSVCFSRHFGTLPWFFEFCFLTDFDASKSVLGSFFALFAKIWPNNIYHSPKSRISFAWPFLPGDLRWPWPPLWSQSTANDTYECWRHYPWRIVVFVCAYHRNFARRCHQARNVEHFDVDLTCDVTRDPEVNKICFPSTVFPGLSDAAWIVRIGPVVSEIRGGLEKPHPPPPVGRVIKIPQLCQYTSRLNYTRGREKKNGSKKTISAHRISVLIIFLIEQSSRSVTRRLAVEYVDISTVDNKAWWCSGVGSWATICMNH